MPRDVQTVSLCALHGSTTLLLPGTLPPGTGYPVPVPGTSTAGGGWQEVAPDILICPNMSGMYPYMPRDIGVMCPRMYMQYPYMPRRTFTGFGTDVGTTYMTANTL